MYRLFCYKKINDKQCIFCSMQPSDTFENLTLVKNLLKNDFSCFSCMGKIDCLYKAFRTAYKLAGAKFIFLDAAYTYTSIVRLRKDTQVIQLWHAAGAFKKIGMHTISSKNDADIERQHLLHGYYNYVIVSSKSVVDTYAEAFGMDKKYILPLGTPRIQTLIEQNKQRKKYIDYICSKYDQCWYKKIVLYAPTFREENGKRNYNPILNLDNFAEQFSDEYIVAIRLHPRAPKSIYKNLPDNVVNISGIPQYIALIISDYLITDYSSVVFDFSALKKPVFFYTPDEYMYTRGLYFKPADKYPNITFHDYYDIVNAILSISRNEKRREMYLNEQDKIYREYVYDTDALQNIKKFILSI